MVVPRMLIIVTVKVYAPPVHEPNTVPEFLQNCQSSDGYQFNFFSAPSEAVVTTDQVIKKWSCLNCTYLNFPKSKKCVQCQIPRGRRATGDDEKPSDPDRCLVVDTSAEKSATTAVPALNVEKLPAVGGNQPRSQQSSGHASPVGSVSVSRSGSGRALRKGSSPRSPASPACGSGVVAMRPASATVSPVAGSSSGSEQPQQTLDSKLIAKKLQKWTCAKCTYENWPKAQRCVMCYAERRNRNIAAAAGSRQMSPMSPNAPTLQNRQSGNNSPTDRGSHGSLVGGNEKKRPATTSSTQGSTASDGGSGKKSPRSSVSQLNTGLDAGSSDDDHRPSSSSFAVSYPALCQFC